MKTGTLTVPGASLYYAVRGTGPILLILQGGAGDAEGSDGIAGHLADNYTVATCDRRGLSRSKLDETRKPCAWRLTATMLTICWPRTVEPAFAFGSSIGALIGLDLAARLPEQVRTLVAHEPPAFELLPADERSRAEKTHEEIQEAFRREGVASAMKKIVAASGVDFSDPDVELPQTTTGPTPRRMPGHR